MVLMEGESLFNDATSIVLFEIFFRMVKRLSAGHSASDLPPLEQGLDILSSIATLAAGAPPWPTYRHHANRARPGRADVRRKLLKPQRSMRNMQALGCVPSNPVSSIFRQASWGEHSGSSHRHIELLPVEVCVTSGSGRHHEGSTQGPYVSVWSQALSCMPRHRGCAAPGGAAIGLAFGVATRLVLKWMHRRGHKAPEQLALTVAVPFLSFYVANGPCARPALLSAVQGLRACALLLVRALSNLPLLLTSPPGPVRALKF